MNSVPTFELPVGRPVGSRMRVVNTAPPGIDRVAIAGSGAVLRRGEAAVFEYQSIVFDEIELLFWKRIS